jgi:hypothetical protein
MASLEVNIDLNVEDDNHDKNKKCVFDASHNKNNKQTESDKSVKVIEDKGNVGFEDVHDEDVEENDYESDCEDYEEFYFTDEER